MLWLLQELHSCWKQTVVCAPACAAAVYLRLTLIKLCVFVHLMASRGSLLAWAAATCRLPAVADACAAPLPQEHLVGCSDVLRGAQALKTEGSPARGSPTHGGYNVQSTYFPEEPEESGYVPPAHAAHAPAGDLGRWCHRRGCK